MPFKIICHPNVTEIRRWQVTQPVPERAFRHPMAPSTTPCAGQARPVLSAVLAHFGAQRRFFGVVATRAILGLTRARTRFWHRQF